MAPKENLTPLKTLVFSMGALLIGGTLLLGGVVWKKLAGESDAAKMADCQGGHVDLKGHGTIIESAVDGQTLRVTLEKQPGKTEAVLIDICTGKIIGRLSLDTDASMITE